MATTAINLNSINLDMLCPRDSAKLDFTKALDDYFSLAKQLRVNIDGCFNLTHLEVLLLRKLNEEFLVNQSKAMHYFAKLENIKLTMLLCSKFKNEKRKYK